MKNIHQNIKPFKSYLPNNNDDNTRTFVLVRFRETEKNLKMKSEYKEIYKKIDEILWLDWDPIGINHKENIRDEYYGYIPQIFSLKIQGANNKKIANYLYEIETINIGTNGDMKNCEFVAEKIINL